MFGEFLNNFNWNYTWSEKQVVISLAKTKRCNQALVRSAILVFIAALYF